MIGNELNPASDRCSGGRKCGGCTVYMGVLCTGVVSLLCTGVVGVLCTCEECAVWTCVVGEL